MIRVLARFVEGIGAYRDNLYEAVSGSQPGAEDNALVFIGSAQAFARTNRGIIPPPPTELYGGAASH